MTKQIKNTMNTQKLNSVKSTTKEGVHCISKDALHIASTEKLSWEETYRQMAKEQDEWAEWAELDIDVWYTTSRNQEARIQSID